VRLFGTGRWNRNDEGKWKLDIFRVESFVPLRDTLLSQALNEIRSINTEWDVDAFAELVYLREDHDGALNGGV